MCMRGWSSRNWSNSRSRNFRSKLGGVLDLGGGSSYCSRGGIERVGRAWLRLVGEREPEAGRCWRPLRRAATELEHGSFVRFRHERLGCRAEHTRREALGVGSPGPSSRSSGRRRGVSLPRRRSRRIFVGSAEASAKAFATTTSRTCNAVPRRWTCTLMSVRMKCPVVDRDRPPFVCDAWGNTSSAGSRSTRGSGTRPDDPTSPQVLRIPALATTMPSGTTGERCPSIVSRRAAHEGSPCLEPLLRLGQALVEPVAEGRSAACLTAFSRALRSLSASLRLGDGRAGRRETHRSGRSLALEPARPSSSMLLKKPERAIVIAMVDQVELVAVALARPTVNSIQTVPVVLIRSIT